MRRASEVVLAALGLVALDPAPGVGRAESLRRVGPEEVTVERAKVLADAILASALAWMEEHAASATESELAALLEEWSESAECAVPVGASPRTPVELASLLEASPESGAIRDEAELDGWGQPIEVYFDPSGLPHRPLLVVRSPGENGVFEGPDYEPGSFEPGDPEDDVVLAFDELCRWPERSRGEASRARDGRALSPDVAAQKRTMADFRNVGTAFLSWLTDQVVEDSDWGLSDESPELVSATCDEAALRGESPPAGCPPATTFVVPEPDERVSFDELERILHPSSTFFYMYRIPRTDGWGRPYEVYLHLEDLSAPRIITLRSAGSDGLYDGDLYEIAPFDPVEADRDIVWADGFFVRWPQTGGDETGW